MCSRVSEAHASEYVEEIGQATAPGNIHFVYNMVDKFALMPHNAESVKPNTFVERKDGHRLFVWPIGDTWVCEDGGQAKDHENEEEDDAPPPSKGRT